jgi:hypothetical protein
MIYDLHIFPNNLAVAEISNCHDKECFAHLYQALDPLFDIIWDWVKTTGQLPCHFMCEVHVSHVLAILHDAHDAGLE